MPVRIALAAPGRQLLRIDRGAAESGRRAASRSALPTALRVAAKRLHRSGQAGWPRAGIPSSDNSTNRTCNGNANRAARVEGKLTRYVTGPPAKAAEVSAAGLTSSGPAPRGVNPGSAPASVDPAAPSVGSDALPGPSPAVRVRSAVPNPGTWGRRCT
jgi:hypothetical protein